MCCFHSHPSMQSGSMHIVPGSGVGFWCSWGGVGPYVYELWWRAGRFVDFLVMVCAFSSLGCRF